MNLMDRDRNKIFDSLDRLLNQVGDKELVPVLIMTNDQVDVQDMERVAGKLQVKYRYTVVPAVAASVTKDQVAVLSRQTFVRQIEHDAEVKIAMDGANRWFGTAKAREDFGVDGGRDGSPGYSTQDIVVAFS